MRSIVILVIGLLAGAAIGAYAFSRFNVSDTTPALPDQPTATKTSQVIPSPFAPIKDDITATAIPIASTAAVPQAEPTDTALPTKLLSEIKHYRDITPYLHFIDSADSDELKALLSQLKGVDERSPFSRTFHTAIYQRWAQIDISEALTYSIAAIKNQRQQYSRWAHEGLSVLAAVDPDFVSDHIEEIESGSGYSELKSALYTGMASNNPEQMAREFIANANLRDPRDFDALYIAINEWANTDPQTAWNFIQTEADSETKSMLSDQILYQWYERDPETAIIEIEALLANGPVDHQQQYMLNDIYISHLAKTDPDAAYQWALSQQDINSRQNALMQLVHSWDENDSAGLQSFINQMDAADRDQLMPMAMSSIASKMARTDPAGAMAWADQLPEGQRFDAQMNIVGQWSMTDPEAAADWLFNLPESQANTDIMMNMAGAFMHGDPAVSMRVFAKMPANVQSQYTEQIIYTLSGREGPEAARQWLSEQPNSDVQETGSIIIDSMDPNSDTTALLNKIATRQGGPRENLLFGTISQRMSSNADEVQQWISSTTLLTSDERSMLENMTSEMGRFGNPYGRPPSMQFDEYNNDSGLYSIEYENH